MELGSSLLRKTNLSVKYGRTGSKIPYPNITTNKLKRMIIILSGFSFSFIYFIPIFRFNNCALTATIIVLKLIKTAPIAGPKTKPEEYKTPAAKGIATTL